MPGRCRTAPARRASVPSRSPRRGARARGGSARRSIWARARPAAAPGTTSDGRRGHHRVQLLSASSQSSSGPVVPTRGSRWDLVRSWTDRRSRPGTAPRAAAANSAPDRDSSSRSSPSIRSASSRPIARPRPNPPTAAAGASAAEALEDQIALLGRHTRPGVRDLAPRRSRRSARRSPSPRCDAG